MATDLSAPDVLLSVSNEIEAAAIVTALAEYDVDALSVGGYTSNFMTSAPGGVAVVVKLADFDRAKQSLTEIQEQQADIDWSNVDVTETPEDQTVTREAHSVRPSYSLVPMHFWWLVEGVGISACFITWLFTRELTPTLVYSSTVLAIAGLFLAMYPFARR
jgi:hypothetical protein